MGKHTEIVIACRETSPRLAYIAGFLTSATGVVFKIILLQIPALLLILLLKVLSLVMPISLIREPSVFLRVDCFMKTGSGIRNLKL